MVGSGGGDFVFLYLFRAQEQAALFLLISALLERRSTTLFLLPVGHGIQAVLLICVARCFVSSYRFGLYRLSDCVFHT